MTMKYASVTRCERLEQENAALRAELKRVHEAANDVMIQRLEEHLQEMTRSMQEKAELRAEVERLYEVLQRAVTGRRYYEDAVMMLNKRDKPEPPQPDAAGGGASGTGEGEI